MDVWQDTTTCDGGTDQAVELLVTSDSKLQVSGRNTLDTQILRCVTCELENLGGKVFENGRGVDGSLGTDADVVLGSVLQVTVDTTDGELEATRQ